MIEGECKRYFIEQAEKREYIERKSKPIFGCGNVSLVLISFLVHTHISKSFVHFFVNFGRGLVINIELCLNFFHIFCLNLTSPYCAPNSLYQVEIVTLHTKPLEFGFWLFMTPLDDASKKILQPKQII